MVHDRGLSPERLSKLEGLNLQVSLDLLFDLLEHLLAECFEVRLNDEAYLELEVFEVGFRVREGHVSDLLVDGAPGETDVDEFLEVGEPLLLAEGVALRARAGQWADSAYFPPRETIESLTEILDDGIDPSMAPDFRAVRALHLLGVRAYIFRQHTLSELLDCVIQFLV